MMKKSGSKVLCMVLIIALLAPNAFAATPTPEAPLADAATVERVKQEIAAGEITDMEDLFLVACQHLGADLDEAGMTAYINEDGTLGITQIISNGSPNVDMSLCHTDDGAEEITYVVSTLGAFRAENSESISFEYNPSPDTASCPIDGTLFVVLHTAYYNGRIVPGQYDDETADDEWEIRINYITTTIYGASPPHSVTKLVQNYEYRIDGQPYEADSKTTNGNLSGTYRFTPVSRSWYPVPSFRYDAIVTSSTVYVSGIAEPVTLEITVSLNETIP